MGQNLRIAIQKSGRLSEKSLDIISKCGIDFSTDGRVLKEEASNFPLEFLFVRDDDIPGYVSAGIADIGIVGRNEFDEKQIPLDVIRDLGFAKCRLSIAVPASQEYNGLKSLEGKRIATSYPNILDSILKKEGVNASYVNVSGSVEVTPAIGVADLICDLVSTGVTLKMNGLKEVETIYKSSAVMVMNPKIDAERKTILDRLLLRIDAVIRAKSFKYIMFNLPEKHLGEVARVVGGITSPTVTKLFDEDWVSVQTVVAEDKFWNVFEELKKLGAQGILVTSIEKMAE